jgi:NAD(P)-dependent dehydrogenase (short-subunit alcohol dehydrogenase family)
VLAARRTELLDGVAREVRNAGGSALVVTADVASPDDVEHLMSATLARFGGVDVWINNAGVGAPGRFKDVPVVDHSRVVNVNLNGVIYGSHTALGVFRGAGAARAELPRRTAPSDRDLARGERRMLLKPTK